jgi:hypothetical protein
MALEAQGSEAVTTQSTSVVVSDLAPTTSSVTPQGVTPPTTQSAPTRPLATLGDDDSPDEENVYTIKGDALKKRLERSKNSELKKMFGTDDRDQIKTIIEEHKQLKSQSEEQRRAQLSESEKLKEDHAKIALERDQWRTKYERVEANREYAKTHREVRSLAAKHIDPRMLPYAEAEFASFLKKTMDPKQMNRLQPKDIVNFFAKLAQKNPRLARAKPTEQPKPKVLISNGANPNTKPGNKVNPQSEKTARPGHPNSKTKAELRSEGWEF